MCPAQDSTMVRQLWCFCALSAFDALPGSYKIVVFDGYGSRVLSASRARSSRTAPSSPPSILILHTPHLHVPENRCPLFVLSSSFSLLSSRPVSDAVAMVLTLFGRELRYHSPWVQNIISGVGVGASAGIYVALNLLGAGGGRPDSAHVVQVVNATLCSVWFFSSSFGGSILNKLGPGITMCLGVQTYAVYVGSLWYYDEVGKTGYPYAAGPIIGIGAGMVFITAGYIATAYPEEKDKGAYATMLMNMQGLGSVIGGIIPVIINRNKATAAGVPRAVYASFIVIMIVGGLITLLLKRPQKLRRDDGSTVAVHPARGAWEELKSNLLIFSDPILLMMLPAFFPAECFLVYSGSVNGNIPARGSTNSF